MSVRIGQGVFISRISAVGSVLDLGSRGREFESRIFDHRKFNTSFISRDAAVVADGSHKPV